ncbi:MAG: DUF362 domain-containing protein [Candidatus Bathyarchaeota archaeon]|uniref:DUF362 domain-containing protein n=1 Tax=Candidatus Bathycorpusculum sp. TaxID=2994959 RepID=UPI002833EFB7|nr:DUF362 domain-containing protein [Candidatus Termiticorpusculum sp.]MCL2256607.1 DUF362 domain-containing protein [Candidatus Termiticorpusculum sp.]MCL2293229.1 DUF362 domain-containing protein [Candidatus Termiticorpusculum sp.]
MTTKTVTPVKVYSAKDTSINDILKEAVANANLQGKKQIFIKPNLSHPEYLPGVVTDPELTSQLIGLLRNKNSEVIIAVGESNGFNYPCWTAFNKTGMKKAVEKAGGTVINLSEDKIVEVNFGNKTSVKRLFLPKTILNADAVIDLPLMKTHEFMAYSGAIKNLFGCIPSNKRIYLHPYLPEVFYHLYTLFKPALTIMDARTGIEGNGPTKGKPVKMNLLLTSVDALALDIVATKIMKLNWENTYLNYIARKTGLLEINIKEEGVPVPTVARRFESPCIDLPVKAQIIIYQHEYLTKLLFCSLDIVQLFQKITMTYRGKPVKEQN